MHQIIKLSVYFSVLFVGVAGHTFATQCKEHFMYNKKKRERFRWKHYLSLVWRDESERVGHQVSWEICELNLCHHSEKAQKAYRECLLWARFCSAPERWCTLSNEWWWSSVDSAMASLDRVIKDQRILLLKYSEKKIKILLRLHPIQLQGYISFMQKSIKSVYGEQKNQSVLNKPGSLQNLMFSFCVIWNTEVLGLYI